jgi:transcriptional regulator with XRE-family HTH domain
LSQEELAQLAGLDRSYVGQVERGQNSIAIMPLAKIAEVLQTSIAQIMADAGL